MINLIKSIFDVFTPAQEKMNPALFIRNYESFRQALIPGRIVDMTELQLPNLSTLHTINHFLDYQTTDTIYPDLTNPLIVNEHWPMYLQFWTQIPSATSKPFPVIEKYTYVANKYKSSIMAFFHEQHRIRRLLSEATVSKMSNTLVINEYAALNHVRLTGQLSSYRHFDIILRTILDHICNSKDKRLQFMQFPLSPRTYTRSQFIKAFDKLNISSIRVLNDPSYFLLIHLLGFIWEQSIEQPHQKLTENTTTEITATDDTSSIGTSLFSLIPDEVLHRLHIVLTYNEKAIIYNFADLKTMATGNTGLFLKVLRHINLLKLHAIEHDLPQEHVSDDEFDIAIGKHQAEHIETPITKSDNSHTPEAVKPDLIKPTPQQIETNPTPPIVKSEIVTIPTTPPKITTPSPLPTTPSKPKEAVTTPSKPIDKKDHSFNFNQHVLNQLNTHLAKNSETNNTTQTKIDELYNRHLAVMLEGKPIAQHLETVLPDIHTNNLDFLEQQLPDASMANSSIANLDTLYIKHGMHHDLAKTLTSLVQHGLFVTNIDTVSDNTEFTKRTIYKVSLTDVNGKRHSLVFALPKVDETGRMLVNGVPTRMTKQQINLPICKVSKDRVNLSSNFNKTIVERTSTKRHSFLSYINTYITSLRLAGLITVHYGKLPNSPTVLPYDYSTIAQTYTRIDGNAGRLYFDYHNRFDWLTDTNISTETYTESVDTNINVNQLIEKEKEYGVFFGVSKDNHFLYMDRNNLIHQLLFANNDIVIDTTVPLLPIAELLYNWYPTITPAKIISEWNELKILDENFPLIFVLGFRFGLSNVLTEHKLEYRWIPDTEKANAKISPNNELSIPFFDGIMVVKRYPLQNSLMLSGLLKYQTKNLYRSEFDSPDVYYRLLNQLGISINYLKGITSFFDFFLDPVTIDVLQHMGEPITVAGLLIRSNEMLSTYDHHAAASMRHHRLRGYERFSGVLYNEMARQLSAYQGKKSQKKSFSINPEAVFQRIMSDSTVSTIETINPIHEIKDNTSLTYSGSGGRTSSRSFVVEDRRYPTDGLGILSEATPDSGKVAMNAYTTADPKLANIRGMFDFNQDALTAANVLSTPAMLMPCSVQDDGKRTNYLSIQLSHHVPCLASEVNRVRTGFEMVIAHRSSTDFAYIAKHDGHVITIDADLHLLKIEYDAQPIEVHGTTTLPFAGNDLKTAYFNNTPLSFLTTIDDANNYQVNLIYSITNALCIKPLEHIIFTDIKQVPDKSANLHATAILQTQLKRNPNTAVVYIRFTVQSTMDNGEIDICKYGSKYTNVSGSYIQQDLVLNVETGERFKRGDVLIYNQGFFAPDPDSKQVNWKHGVMANVALIEMGATLEDSSMISKQFGEKLSMSPAHVRQIELTSNTVIHSIVEVGDQIDTDSQLCVIEEGDIEALAGVDDIATLSFLSTLNRKILRAKYHGTVADIQLYYSCPEDNLHPTIANLAKKLKKQKLRYAKAAKDTIQEENYITSQYVAPGTKYRGTLFGDDSVLVLITIAESIVAGVGDKICVALQAKSVIGETMEYAPVSQSGVTVDVIFSSTSIAKRIINSPLLIGIANRVLETMEQTVTDMYFKE